MDGIVNLVLSGALGEGDKLPSVRELALQLAINPNTIQRAYRELETKGFICSVPGKGSFISDRAELMKERRTELFRQFDAAAAELMRTGVTKEELASRLVKEVVSND